MALKITIKVGAQDVILEGTPSEVVSAARGLMVTPGAQALAPQRASLSQTPDIFSGIDKSKGARADGKLHRSPRGENKKHALQALASFGQEGGRQALVQKFIAKAKSEKIAISSVRHALIQLKSEGAARRDGDIWRITSAGITALARMEAA